MTEASLETRSEHTRARANERAQLYLCLGHALLPPVQPGIRDAFARDLVTDLDELIPERQVGSELTTALAFVADDTTLLRAYSHLFLVPPYPAALNAGLYIDRTIMGPSVVDMERFYQRHGLTRDTSFRDTPDHLALQLQFLALLLDLSAQAASSAEAQHGLQEARDFLTRFLRPWTATWVRKLEDASLLNRECQPYVVLGKLVRDLIAEDADWLHGQAPLPATDASGPAARIMPALASVDQAVCARCSKPFIPSAELAGMLKALQEQGLGTEHLTVCMGCRTTAMGLSPLSADFKEVKRHGGQAR